MVNLANITKISMKKHAVTRFKERLAEKEFGNGEKKL